MAKRILFVLAAILLAGAGFYYRTQNTKTAQVKEAYIVVQDSEGADVTAMLDELKLYAASHMGSSVKLTLDGSYSRAQAATKAAVVAASAANSQIYADAQRVCGTKADSITLAHCNQDYITKHLANLPAPAPVAQPKLADYQRTIRAPAWTPDLAGALFLGAAAAAILSAFTFIGGRRRER
jgi:hypothetical protein